MSFRIQPTRRFLSKFCMGAVGAAMLSWPSLAGAQTVLDSGQSHVIEPRQTECLTITRQEPPKAVLPIAEARCDEASGTADVTADTGLSPLSVDVVARSVFQFWFTVADPGGAAQASLVPVHVRVPDADWAFLLFNDHLVALAGSASADILLQLRRDPDLDPDGRGDLIGRTSILAATHGGVSGCLSIPMSTAATLQLVVKCALNSFQRLRGSSGPSLNAIVETGRTYNVELVITARARSGLLTAPVATAAAQSGSLAPPAPGLRWREMVITVGTDPAALVAGLQEQIDQLRRDLNNHTHNYLTGRVRGHNNTLAVSSPAIVPGTAAAGLTASQLQSGPVANPQNKKKKKKRKKRNNRKNRNKR